VIRALNKSEINIPPLAIEKTKEELKELLSREATGVLAVFRRKPVISILIFFLQIETTKHKSSCKETSRNKRDQYECSLD
jgi:RIO-like serine/threonine protein kinase